MTKNIATALLFSLATIVMLGYIWFVQTEPRLVATNNRTVARELEFGQRNYEQYCASCHGLAGEGGGPTFAGAPPLNNLQDTKGPGTTAYTDTNGIQKKYGTLRNYIEARISAGVPGTLMPAWKGLMRDDQIRAVAAYLMSMQGGAVTADAKAVAGEWKQTEIAKLPPSPTPSEPPLDDPVANEGRAVFRSVCAGCHGVGEAKIVGPGLAGLFGPDGTAAYGPVLPNGEAVTDASVAEWIKVGGGGPGVGPEPLDGEDYTPMGGMAAAVNDEQIAQIIAYLKTLER